jgi:hypothetical protein
MWDAAREVGKHRRHPNYTTGIFELAMLKQLMGAVRSQFLTLNRILGRDSVIGGSV